MSSIFRMDGGLTIHICWSEPILMLIFYFNIPQNIHIHGSKRLAGFYGIRFANGFLNELNGIW